MTLPMIDIRNLSKEFVLEDRPQSVLSAFNLQVTKGEFICVVGPSGCGKTTLLNLIGGFDVPTSGSIAFLNGELKVTSVLQHHALFPWRSVAANVEFGMEVLGLPKKERVSTAKEYMRMFGIDSVAAKHPHEISGGMQQRAVLAQALTVNPDILLMDEPLGALDAVTRKSLQEIISDIRLELGLTVIFVTHDIEEAVFLADRIVVMSLWEGAQGEIVEVGLPYPRNRSDERLTAMRDLVYGRLNRGGTPSWMNL